ncbi:MAG: hypothetical protein V4722_05035 [Bacteroidota bacterium]
MQFCEYEFPLNVVGKIAIISCIICLLIAVIISWYVYSGMSRSNKTWGMYGITFLEFGGAYGLAGFVLICFPKTREPGKGILLAGLLLLLLGGSVCSGLIRF